jgi:hypothetical protein
VRPEAAVELGEALKVGALERLVEVELADVEEAILQAEIDIRRDRLANARQDLPSNGPIIVVDRLVDRGRHAEAARSDVEVVADVRPAGTGAEEAAPSVFVAEVEQDVGHGRPDGYVAVTAKGLGRVRVRNAGREFDQILVDLDFVNRRALVTELELAADQTKVVPGDKVNVEADIVIDDDAVIEVVAEIDVVVVVEVEVRILDQHDAGINANIH